MELFLSFSTNPGATLLLAAKVKPLKENREANNASTRENAIALRSVPVFSPPFL